MPLYKYEGGLLTRDGALATSVNCCCACGCPNPPPTLTVTLGGAISGTGTLVRGPDGFNYTSDSIALTGCEDDFGVPGVVEAIVEVGCIPSDDGGPDVLRVFVTIEGALCPFQFSFDVTDPSCDPISFGGSTLMASEFPGCVCNGELITVTITE